MQLHYCENSSKQSCQISDSLVLEKKRQNKGLLVRHLKPCQTEAPSKASLAPAFVSNFEFKFESD